MRSIIDSHVHLCSPDSVANLLKIAESIGAVKIGLASIADRDNVNDNPLFYWTKWKNPDKFFAFAALDHSADRVGGKIEIPSFLEQAKRALAIGADGIKLLETKPDRRKWIDIPIDSAEYEPMFAYLESSAVPLIWHVADPEEFWDPDTTPGWAKEHNWGYDDTFIQKEQLYAEVENVMQRHPNLKVIFAHFYFLTADLPRASAFLDRYKNVCFDLAPGIEMLYNLSRDPVTSREFFIKYKDRIVYGTDIDADQPIPEAGHRAGIVMKWLESSDEFRVPEGADFLLGPPEDGIIRGMSLPEDVLNAIYVGNFTRMAGARPKKINVDLAKEECSRIASIIEFLGGKKEDTIPAWE